MVDTIPAAYSELLDCTAAGDATADVATIAEAHGLRKTPRPWNGERGRRELHTLESYLCSNQASNRTHCK